MQNKYDSTTIMTLEDVYSELKKEEVTLQTKYSYINSQKTKNKTVTLSLGRCWINTILPDSFRLIDEPINNKKLRIIVNEVFNNYEVGEAARVLSLLNLESFHLASISPVTFDINSCIVPEEIIKRRDIELTKDTKPEDFSGRLKNISEDYVDNYLSDTGIGNIIKSGAKGSATDLGVLTIAKGPTIDIEGNISEPIITALSEGYSGKEYYTAAAEARRTLYIRAVGTAEPGYLARTVTYANSNVLLSEDDCKTKKYLNLFIKGSFVNRLIGRFMMNDITGSLEEITSESKIINKTIQLRSPLFCKSETGICKICYGKLAEKVNSKHLGLLAASAINSAGINSSMKARHISQQVKLKEVDFISDMLHI